MPKWIDQVDAYLDGELPSTEAAALRQWINADASHARSFAKRAVLHQEIRSILHRSRMQTVQNPRQVLQELLEHETNAQAELVEIHTLSGRTFPRPKQFATLFANPQVITGIAAVVILSLSLFLIFQNGDDTPGTTPDPDQPQGIAQAPTAVAKLTATHDAQWGGPASAGLVTGDSLHPSDRLTLTAGFAEITTKRGAVAILEAPATIELLDNDNAIRLHAGKMVGQCHTESSKGFVVKTAHAQITDLGTEFGVEARHDGVEATVFVGEIEFNAPGGLPQRITHSQTARLSVQGVNRALVIEDYLATGFIKRMPRAPLVTAAHINLQGHEVQVVAQGVAEDARVRTDRDHEINGIDEGGIPVALLGGDLVRTPSDARRLGGLEIVLELARPATVYLLVPNLDGQVPSWLTEQYVPTDMRVGIDHGLALAEKSNPALIGVGPGQSIDDQRVVWRRKHAEVGRVTVGGSMLNTSSMYGIIVVPADESGVGRPSKR